MNRNNVLIVAVLLFVVSAFGVWLYQNLVHETEYVQTQGYTSEARENGYHAAERLLTRLGREAHSVRKLTALPTELDSTDNLILSTPGYALNSSQVDTLLTWVEQGGHLLLATYRAYDLDRDSGVNKLFDHLDLSVTTSSESEGEGEDEEDENEPFDSTEEQTDTITLPGSIDGLKVKFHSRFLLQDTNDNATWAFSDDDGTRLLHYQQGQGAITVLSELRLFQNRQLGQHDNADLLWQLLQLNGNTGTVWLQYAPVVPSLLELLWRHAWMPLLGLLLTLIAILWAANQRLGPKRLTRSETRRSLLEHIQASGHFMWRQQGRATLIAAVQQRTQQKLHRRHPHWRTLDIPAQAEHLARLLDLPQTEIEAALADNNTSDQHLFTRRIQQLQQLANKL